MPYCAVFPTGAGTSGSHIGHHTPMIRMHPMLRLLLGGLCWRLSSSLLHSIPKNWCHYSMSARASTFNLMCLFRWLTLVDMSMDLLAMTAFMAHSDSLPSLLLDRSANCCSWSLIQVFVVGKYFNHCPPSPPFNFFCRSPHPPAFLPHGQDMTLLSLLLDVWDIPSYT